MTVSKNAHHASSKCNDGVTWYHIPRVEKSELPALFPGHCYYITHPGNATQKVKHQATRSITSLKQTREKTYSNLILKLIKASNNKNPNKHRFYLLPEPHFLGSSSHPKKSKLSKQTPHFAPEIISFNCLYKVAFQTSPSGIERVKCPQVPASPVNHLLPQLGDKQLCRTKSPRCAAVRQPGNSLQLR